MTPSGSARTTTREVAERLVEQAREEGLDLVGPDGVLTALTKKVLEIGLEAELSEHLGYDKHAPEGRDGGNFRNGTRSKTVLTEVGTVPRTSPAIGRARLNPSWSRSANGGCAGSTRWCCR